MKITMKKLMAMILFVPCLAFAAPKVVLDLKAEKEVKVVEDGKEVIKRVPADTVEPGQQVFYTLAYKNEGDTAAVNVEIKNKIPESTVYLLDSAWGEGAEIQFSIDKGKTYKQPSLLIYEVKGADGKVMQKKASPETYTDVMWVVKEVQAGKSGTVGFIVQVN